MRYNPPHCEVCGSFASGWKLKPGDPVLCSSCRDILKLKRELEALKAKYEPEGRKFPTFVVHIHETTLEMNLGTLEGFLEKLPAFDLYVRFDITVKK